VTTWVLVLAAVGIVAVVVAAVVSVRRALARRRHRRADVLAELTRAHLSVTCSEPGGHGTRRIVIRNLGPAPAELSEVVILDADVRVHRSGFEYCDVIDLRPLEEHEVAVTLPAHHLNTLHTQVEWTDGFGHQTTDQTIVLP
jgi:hypothetical protein